MLNLQKEIIKDKIALFFQQSFARYCFADNKPN